MTANAKFVLSAENKGKRNTRTRTPPATCANNSPRIAIIPIGVKFCVFLHGARALTERKRIEGQARTRVRMQKEREDREKAAKLTEGGKQSPLDSKGEGIRGEKGNSKRNETDTGGRVLPAEEKGTRGKAADGKDIGPGIRREEQTK